MKKQIKDPVVYLASLIEEEQRLKEANKKGLFRINEKISDNVAKAVMEHYQNGQEYRVDVRKCKSCVGTWDIMIYFLY